MKKQVFLLVLCLLVSCTGQQQPAPSSVPPTSNIALTIPASTETSIPTITPLPPDTVAYYRIRVEYATTSDWSTLELTTPDPVLAMKTVQVNGEPSGYAAGIPNLSLNQPLSEAGRPVSLIVEYAITPDAIDNGLQFRMQKGDVGSGILDIYILTNGTQERIQSEKYSGVVPNSSGLNPKLFSVDLSPLKGTSPWIASVSRAGREKMVWAFYYMWYYPDGWSSSWLKDRPLEWYASASREVIAKQVDQAQSAGIDGFISSWWDPAATRIKTCGNCSILHGRKISKSASISRPSPVKTKARWTKRPSAAGLPTPSKRIAIIPPS